MINSRIFLTLIIINYSAYAKDFGKLGNSFEVKEESFQDMIMRRLSQKNIEHEQKKVEEKVRNKVLTPRRISGIINTIKPRSFLYDPTYIVEEDIIDEQGIIVLPKNTRLNVLDQEELGKKLIFLDGENNIHLKWFEENLSQGEINDNDTIILIAGSPITLEERFKKIFYFDQFGEITTKLGIKQVPAIVSQHGNKLKVQEVLANEI